MLTEGQRALSHEAAASASRKHFSPGNSVCDITVIIQASSLLEISEYRLFQIAHQVWYGHGIPDRRLEKLFHDYLFFETAPFWVGRFAKTILSLYEKGCLDPAKYDIYSPDVDEKELRRGKCYMVVLAFVIIFFCIFIANFPPY